MPERVETTPQNLRAYIALGMDLTVRGPQADGDCPFCGKEGKLTIEVATGKSRCFVCAEGNEKGGLNPRLFIEEVWKHSKTTDEEYDVLVRDRKLLSRETLKEWGVRRSFITGDWLIPAYGPDGAFRQVYRYMRIPNTGKTGWVTRLLPTPGVWPDGEAHAVFGGNLFDKSKKGPCYACEGPWDGMALYEVLKRHKEHEGGFVTTAVESSSLYAVSNVIAFPGANVVPECYLEELAGTDLVLLYDNDHPGTNKKTGEALEPTGYGGMRRATELLLSQDKDTRPNSVRILRWGELGYDPNLPDGFDVRDLLTVNAPRLSDRTTPLQELFRNVTDTPQDWVARAQKAARKHLQPLPCESWSELKNACRLAMKWTDGLDHGFAALLASALSLEHLGDQIWLMVLGPPSCGKSTMAEALAVARKHVVCRDTFTKLTTGYQIDAEGSKNMSLILKMKGKMFIVKDGDTLRAMPNRQQILSQLRGLYDRAFRVEYGNKMSLEEESLSTIVAICGTASMRELDKSELGSRYLIVSVMDSIDKDLEREVSRRSANRIRDNLGVRVNGKAESMDTEDMIRMKQLTGGYVNFLRERGQDLLKDLEFGDEAAEECLDCAAFISHMRARPSTVQEEVVERELSHRLSNQLTLLAACLAVVLGKKSVDEEVIARIRKIARDTSEGTTLSLVKKLYTRGESGMESAALAVAAGEAGHNVSGRLRFLRKIGTVERFDHEGPRGGVKKVRWRLTGEVDRLYTKVMGV